jgi:hypothetical protein
MGSTVTLIVTTFGGALSATLGVLVVVWSPAMSGAALAA